MSLLLQQATAILEAACDAKIGMIVKFDFTDSPKLSLYQVTRYLYKVRKELNLPFIMMRASPDNPDTEMWLFKTKEEHEAPKKTPTKELNINDIE
jgi:hypothetical protein